MANENNQFTGSEKASCFRIEGQIRREQPECQSGELKLTAYVFDKAGTLIGRTDIDNNGNYSVPVQLSQPADTELVIGPSGDAQQIRHSSAYRKKLSAEEWKIEGMQQFKLRYDTVLPLDIWRPWLPLRICINGHVRKVSQHDDITDICPVPYVKVEIFDVDREAFWWPWLSKWWEMLLDRPVIRIPELLKDPPFPPRPFSDPDPATELNPKMSTSPFTKVAINPQPEPPASSMALSSTMRVGEARLIDNTIAARLEQLTLTSKIAIWDLFPRYFYSKVKVCETTTDCNGYFNCCFNWWPFHFRRGRLRFDSRPDILVKVTQIIDGVSTVIYMDPYTSTRWNVNNAHIDLFLDNEDVICSHSHCYEPPAGSPVFFTRIGDDEVYQIDQTTGLYNDTSYRNVAYGHTLYIYGQFGDGLTRSDPAHGDPPPYFYYRLSYAKQGSNDNDFKFINVSLNDTRVNKTALNNSSQSYKLGPYTVNGVPSLYEVRNFKDYYWYNPEWVGIWHSWLTEEDTGTYILRLELFDKNGNKLKSDTVKYLNGAGIGNGKPPVPLLSMTDSCDLVITLDNKPPKAELVIPSAINDCGVIPWNTLPPLDFYVNASQENNRLRGWQLWYTKGLGSEQTLTSSCSDTIICPNNGLPGSFIHHKVSGAPLLVDLNSTCAFALRLEAWAHIRNGRHFIFYDQDINAIVIEKCDKPA